MRHVMILNGGWPEHAPERIGDFIEGCLASDYSVSRASKLSILRPDVLDEVDMLVLIWTYGEIKDEELQSLMNAVERGMGLMAWHGSASAFLANRPYKFLLGGQFVDHPGGAQVTYRVRFSDDPLTAGIADIDVTTEQNYYLIDPSVQVIASTRIMSSDRPWLYGVEMPVAWKRDWGKGKVFYCSLGHKREDLESPSIRELLSRVANWLSLPVSGGQGFTR